ncbi:hypothetical protein [Salinimicrobium sp. GXAS 041]|uniref:hypothetical protein n=1 Tax=Salinimicrobium sp. GXAS 041 TaxID=3400806 RepID=UPI003C73483D
MKQIPPFLHALLVWLIYKANFSVYSFNGRYFEFNARLTARWYSPFFWILALLLIPVAIIDGGLIGWWKDMKDEFKGRSERGYKGSFKPELNKTYRKLLLWRLVYAGK